MFFNSLWLKEAIDKITPKLARKADAKMVAAIVADAVSGTRIQPDSIPSERVFMSFSGKRHSGHGALRGDRLVLRMWLNGSMFGDGDEQEIVIDRENLAAVKKVIELAESDMAAAEKWGF